MVSYVKDPMGCGILCCGNVSLPMTRASMNLPVKGVKEVNQRVCFLIVDCIVSAYEFDREPVSVYGN